MPVSPPPRPAHRRERLRVLREEVLAGSRDRGAPGRRGVWWLATVCYLPVALLLCSARLLLVLGGALLAVTLLPRRLAAALFRRLVLPLLGWSQRVAQVEHLRQAIEEEAFFVVVPNHVFYVDSVVITLLLWRWGGARVSLLGSTLMGGKAPWLLLARLGLVERVITTRSVAATAAEKEGTRRELQAAIEEAQRSARPNPLVVFPEGQVHDCERYLLRYERFCFGLGHPVLPVATRLHYPGPWRLWVAGDHPALTWFLLLALPYVRWSYTVLPLAAAASGESADAFAGRIQGQTADALGAQPTEFTIYDVGELLEELHA